MGLKCGFGFAVATLLLVVLMMPKPTSSARNIGGGSGNWTGFGFNYTNWAQRNNKFVVGGSQHWRFGFDYSNWAIQNGPFFQNDTLVFMYDPPNGTFMHSVYLLKDFRSFMSCNLKKATLVGNVMQGGGAAGFKFVLKESKPYYFACGEHDGIHCKVGLMKFFVWPLKPPCRSG